MLSLAVCPVYVGIFCLRCSNCRSLQCVLTEKYDWSEEEAEAFSDCFLPMLDASPSKRATAAEAARHPWFNDGMPNADQTEE
jgi:hypothetical protein